MNTELLEKILSIPTAPFREHLVLKFTSQVLTDKKIPHFSDPVGNIVIGARNEAEYLNCLNRRKTPLLFFIAHTDHPGFHGVQWQKVNQLSVEWHGGSPTKLLNGANVWACGKDGRVSAGRLKEVKLNQKKSALSKAVVLFDSESHIVELPPREVFGGFSFRKPVWRSNQIYYTKAADDLVGAFSIIELAVQNRSRLGKSFLGILTRAEEVGFVGAIEHFKLGWVQRAQSEVVCISLETSRQLPGAIVGQGPIVRLGDRATMFDATGIEHLTRLARETLGKKFQRRIMDGGTCEGTAANAFGFRTIAMSVPLGNYHNQSFEGGPDSRGSNGPAPEFVDRRDVDGLIRLCQALIQCPINWERVWLEKTKYFDGLVKKYHPLLFA